MSRSLKTPYAELIAPLISAIMRAQATIIEQVESGLEIPEIPDCYLNAHFSWLAPYSTRPTNRHLVDGQIDGTSRPLLNQALRHVRAYPDEIKRIFETHSSIPAQGSIPDEESLLFKKYVRYEPTRVSNLLKLCMSQNVNKLVDQTKDGKFLNIPSPLHICYQLLCVPDSPASFPYAFLAVRNFLIETFNDSSSVRFDSFSQLDLVETVDYIMTSLRSRYYSRGKDKLPAGRPNTFSPFLREFFGFTGVFNFRFSDVRKGLEYLRSGHFKVAGKNLQGKSIYEYAQHKRLQRLPENGDLANQIWGLPLPIRGADVLFRGGLKFPDRNGLVTALHGGPGSGKTSLALGVGAALSGYGISTLYFTAEETKEDLHSRAATLVPTAFRRLSFFPKSTDEWLDVQSINSMATSHSSTLDQVADYFSLIRDKLIQSSSSQLDNNLAKSPCRIVVVLDGLHELVNRSFANGSTDVSRNGDKRSAGQHFYEFIDLCKSLRALVILTTGDDWNLGAKLDYLVDNAIHLKHDTSLQDGGKPERLLTLSKARHQSCSAGTHGLQISGDKGVRITPQTNFCLDLDSIWRTCLSDEQFEKRILTRVAKYRDWSSRRPARNDFVPFDHGVKIYRSSNIFLNGEGSGGKAGMALKIAAAPYYDTKSGQITKRSEKILIISFLYPEEYYGNVHQDIRRMRAVEIEEQNLDLPQSRIEVIQFYPGFLKAYTLFSRIEWQIIESELMGDPFTTVILDGLHNIFIQFPELEKHRIIWPQIYSMLRRRDITIITTHTVLMVATIDPDGEGRRISIDDNRSDPLRHALVQKTDFSFEVDPVQPGAESANQSVEYVVRALSAIGQGLPRHDQRLYWHREKMFFYAEVTEVEGEA